MFTLTTSVDEKEVKSTFFIVHNLWMSPNCSFLSIYQIYSRIDKMLKYAGKKCCFDSPFGIFRIKIEKRDVTGKCIKINGAKRKFYLKFISNQTNFRKFVLLNHATRKLYLHVECMMYVCTYSI